jgi:acyl-CoA synthetase (AMP-forming)/AMP-acid ligase II
MTIADLASIEALEQQNPNPFERLTSTYQMIADGAALNPNNTALSFFISADTYTTPATWTYTEWLQDITRAANCFRRLGITRHDVVAYILPNLPETHLCIWGGETAGIVFAVNSLLEGDSIRQLLENAKARWIVTLAPTPNPEIWNRVEEALSGWSDDASKPKGVLSVDALRHLPGSPQGSIRADRTANLPESIAGLPVLDFHQELAKDSAEALDFELPKAHDIASYFCTGGTTGLPKIAQHTHRNETANVIQLRAMAPKLMQPGKTLFTCLPLFHVNAQLGTGLSVFACGAHSLLAPPAGYRTPRLMENFWAICAHHNVASFSGVPTAFAGLLQASTQGHDLSSLMYAICGAAPMPVELLNKFEAATGMKVLEGYGLTESTAVASICPADGEQRVGSIGIRLPWQQLKTAVLDDNGAYVRDADTDEIGVIILKGPNKFAGYLDEAQNKGAWVSIPEDDEYWLNTGDLGRIDADGYIWLTGRKKELIIRGGHNIDPKVIEEGLAAHPAVAMSAAIGRPDKHSGEVPVAYVQITEGANVSVEELLADLTARLSERAAIPKEVIIIDALPLTAVGKTFKPALVMREIENVVRNEAKELGIELNSVVVEQDNKLGMVAHITLRSESHQVLEEALALYTFKTQLHSSK